LKGFASQLVAFSLFLANREQSYTRTPIAKHAAEVDFSHYGELFKVVSFAIDVSTNIEQLSGGADRGRKYSGKRWAIDAGNGSQHHLRGCHGSAGVAGGNESLRSAIANQTKSNAHGRIAFGANGMHSFVIHRDDFAGMNDFDGKLGSRAISLEFSFDHSMLTDQSDMNAILPCRVDRTFDLGLRRAVRTHRVQSYDAWHEIVRLAAFLNVEDFSPFVIAAFWASAMGLLALVAVRTLGERWSRQKIVGASCAGALLRVAPFWIRHLKFLFYSRTDRVRQILFI
jgi:hypothetical protein